MELKTPLLLLWLLTAAELSGRKAAAAAPQTLRRRSESPVKLCGRDFIRAVIFTCGASRWRRLSERRAAEKRWLSGEFAQSNSDQGIEDTRKRSVKQKESENLQYINELANQMTNSLRRKRDRRTEFAAKCCNQGCTTAELTTKLTWHAKCSKNKIQEVDRKYLWSDTQI